MGIAAARLSDVSTGHACFPPTSIVSGCMGNVLINGMPAAVVGSMYTPHSCGDTVHPVRTISGGSGSVMINGVPAARVGDPISCGDSVGSGSGDVFLG